jgi:Ca2+-dependent lipid-binding protein
MLENREKYRNENQDKAMLTVDVIEARDLMPMDLNGFSDPFVILTIGDDTIQTTYKKNDLNPVWNESFIFEISHA